MKFSICDAVKRVWSFCEGERRALFGYKRSFDNPVSNCKVKKKPKKKFHGTVYVISCPDGKEYVGATKNYARRIGDLKRAARNKPKTPIELAISKFGWDNCKRRSIVDGIRTKSELDACERYYREMMNTVHPYGYNR